MKNLNLLLLGAAAIGGFYLFNKSKEKELASSGIEEELDALEEQVNRNETDIITNTGRIVEQESALQSALEGQISIDDIDLSGVYTKDEVADLLNQKANSIDVYTKSDVDSRLLNKVNTGSVYDKSEIDSRLLNKANTADVYTKSNVDSKLLDKANVNSVYTKGQTDTLLSGKQAAGNYVYQGDFDNELDSLKDEAELYADDIRDGIEVTLANDFYSKSQIDSGFQVKGSYATSADLLDIDSDISAVQDYSDAQDAILDGELKNYANTAASNVGNSVLNSAKDYTNDEIYDLEFNIEENYAQLSDLPIMSNYATLQQLNTGLEGKQPAGDYITDNNVDLYIEDYIDGEGFLTEANAEQMFLDKDLGDYMGQFVFGAANYPAVANYYKPNIYPSTSSIPAGFSGFRFSAW